MVALPFGRLSNRALAAACGKCRCGPLGRGNYKIPDIRIGTGFYPALSALCLRRPHFFQQRKKWGKERRQKPMVFGIPFVLLQLRCKKVPQRIASAPTLAAADMARRAQWSPSRLGDYQIAHLPPPALLYLPPAGSVPRSEARNIPFENKSAGRCGRRVRALRPPVRKKERPPKRSFFFGSELSSN